MNSRIFEGVWEDVARDHAQALKGHRVEIRVLDGREAGTPQTFEESWSEFESRVAAISRGRRIPGGRMYTAVDFFESRD